ncbi:Uncharacterized conserved protein [Dyella sp. OK004]|uniref:GFA family protein n=1 Tax=Dyella sp. OK004 TaxID=1855292 RepID=UPI0008DFBF38|nr:GFA family protein [Dyella sp. OK004]SFR94568.1 Uncharacterized conserved protein [Dyella sp. OK004]
MDRPIEGGCLCGAVRYRTSGAPLARTLCHCRSCRRASGAAAVAWVVFRTDDFAFVEGAPAEFSSSPGVVRGFCSQCGTPLTYRRATKGDTIDVTTATLDAANDFAPTKEIWVEHKLAWACLNDTLPHYAGSSTGASPLPSGDTP